MASNDTTFVSKVTGIVVAWAQAINDFVFKGRNPNYVISTGSANAYTITLPSGTLYSAIASGDAFTFKTNFSNTGSATLTIVGSASLGPYTMQYAGANLTSGMIASGAVVTCVIDGTNAHIIASASVAGLSIATGKTLTISNTLTLAGTDSTTMTFPTTSATLARTDAANVFTGNQTVGTINKITLTTPATGSTLTLTDGKTLTATNTITLSGTDSTTMTFPPASASIGYLNIPQNSQSTAYTVVLADSGKHIYHPVGDNNARAFTIDSNANVPFALGTALTFINRAAASCTIPITSDTLTWSPSGTTGTRTLAQYGVATAVKITTTEWIITGTGLT